MGVYPVVFQSTSEEIFSYPLPYRMTDEVESVGFRFA